MWAWDTAHRALTGALDPWTLDPLHPGLKPKTTSQVTTGLGSDLG